MNIYSEVFDCVCDAVFSFYLQHLILAFFGWNFRHLYELTLSSVSIFVPIIFSTSSPTLSERNKHNLCKLLRNFHAKGGWCYSLRYIVHTSGAADASQSIAYEEVLE